MADEIKVDPAAASAAARGFNDGASAISEAGSLVKSANDVFQTFKGATAEAMMQSFVMASLSIDKGVGATQTLGGMISNAQQSFTNTDAAVANALK